VTGMVWVGCAFVIVSQLLQGMVYNACKALDEKFGVVFKYSKKHRESGTVKMVVKPFRDGFHRKTLKKKYEEFYVKVIA
jgi:hypothetical protein